MVVWAWSLYTRWRKPVRVFERSRCTFRSLKMMYCCISYIVNTKPMTYKVYGVRLQTGTRTSLDAESLAHWNKYAHISNVLGVMHVSSFRHLILSKHHEPPRRVVTSFMTRREEALCVPACVHTKQQYKILKNIHEKTL